MPHDGIAAFRRAASRGNVVPVVRELAADCLTPVLAWLGAASRARRSFLLESVEGGERLARYSFIGRDPYLVLTARGRALTQRDGRRTVRSEGDVLERLREILGRLRPAGRAGLPPFTGGAVGYLCWEAAELFEPASGVRRRGGGVGRGGGLPDASFSFYDTVLAFDHVRQSILMVASVRTEASARPLDRQYAGAVERLDRLASELARVPRGAARLVARPPVAARPAAPARGRAAPPDRFAKAVRRTQDYIRAGEVYQAVLSRRVFRRLSGDAFSVYRGLRRINPSPYMYYLRDDGTVLAGASPEMLVKVEAGRVELRPIAGTRPRGATAGQDAAMEAELRADPKERAEHVMLVDLGRNDLGRVCEPGSIHVDELMAVERYSHVMHLVSRLTGRLGEGRDAFDALRAAFPAGTVSGAPKVRAMQIIAELERAPRGPYAGAVCYLDHSGNLDSCIVIRTMVARGRSAWVQAGAGIVADSDPGREYRECASKARAVLSAIQGAGAWGR